MPDKLPVCKDCKKPIGLDEHPPGFLNPNFHVGWACIKNLKERISSLESILSKVKTHLRELAEIGELEDNAFVEYRDKWSENDFMPKVGGKSFRCDCGCNVFRKSMDGKRFKCNACDAVYQGS